jgi:hypothetical protein
LTRRGHAVIERDIGFFPQDEVDATIISSVRYLEPVRLRTLKRPIFLLPHGAGIVKNVFFKELAYADHIFMTGPIRKERMRYLFPKYQGSVEIGFPKSDELVNGNSTRAEIIREFALDPAEPVIVYAPTWDGKDAIRRGTIDVLPKLMSIGIKNLLICVHEYDKTYNEREKERIVKAPNFNRYLLAADLLIGDISSIMVEFALLNKPMVQIDMFGDRRMYGIWEKPINNYGTFQAGEFATPDTLKKAVEAALSDPKKYEFLRKYWVDRCLYNIGKASMAAVDSIEKMTTSYAPPRKRFFFL